jgi:hypothetical protein
MEPEALVVKKEILLLPEDPVLDKSQRVIKSLPCRPKMLIKMNHRLEITRL